MYIVQIKNRARFVWREFAGAKCKFRSLDKTVALHDSILRSPTYAGMDVRIWCTESDHRVEF